MGLKDAVITWYIQHVLIPGSETIDKPGFITTRLGGKGFWRDILMPEDFLALVEERTVKRFGRPGREALYRAGKRFGQAFAYLGGFSSLKTDSAADVEKFTYLFTKLVGAAYSRDASSASSVGEKKFSFKGRDFIGCTKSGIGAVFMEGGAGGVFAHAFNDATVDCVKKTCCGKGDEYCSIDCAPSAKGIRVDDGLDAAYAATYAAMNQPAKTTYSQTSLKDLLDSGKASWESRMVRFGRGRFFFCECHLPYFLEDELAKFPGGAQLIFKAAFDYGTQLAEEYDGTPDRFISDHFAAAGMGDAFFTGDRVVFKHFPWTRYFSKIRLNSIAGIVSGIVSGSGGKKTVFALEKAAASDAGLDLVFARKGK